MKVSVLDIMSWFTAQIYYSAFKGNLKVKELAVIGGISLVLFILHIILS